MTVIGRAPGEKILVRNQRDLPCPVPLAKIFLFSRNQITSTFTPSRPTKGRCATSRNAGRDAVDAGGAGDEASSCGRPSRVVLAPRRRCQVGGGNPAGDGDKKARSPGRARNRPLTPSRAGMPGDSGGLVVTNSCGFLPTRGCGCIGRPAFPTPFRGG